MRSLRAKHTLSASTDESTLVSAAQRGDKSAFTLLVRRHEAVNRAIAFSVTRSQEEMEDALQESYLKAYRSFASFDGKNFKAWIGRIIRNTAIDMMRSRHGKTFEPIDDEMVSTGMPIEESVTTQLDVHAALAQLTEAHRTAVLLVDGQQCSYHEAADIMNIPRGTAATRVAAARQHLRTVLNDETGNRHE